MTGGETPINPCEGDELNPKFRVGQVVRINTKYYDKAKRYQKIVAIFPWICSQRTDVGNIHVQSTKFPFGYRLANKDECNEKFLAPLSERELGTK